MKNRKMNFEILRILCIIMIILHHYVIHGGIIDYSINNANKILSEFLFIGGKVGVIIFVLISSYFLSDAKKIKIEKIVQIYFEVVFYSLGIYLILIIFGKIEFSVFSMIKACFPFSYNEYWFITNYIALYLISPFLNKFIENISENNYKVLLSAGFIFLVCIPTILPKSTGIYNEFIYFVYIFFVAIYLKKNNNIFKNKIINLLSIIIIFVFIFIVSVISTFLAEYNSIFKLGIDYFITKGNSIPIFLLSISIFELFRKMNVNYSRIVEILASNSLAVYILHDNKNFKGILWKEILQTEKFYDSSILIYSIHVIICILIIYASAIVIEIIRKKIFKAFLSFLLKNKKVLKVVSLINSIENKIND